MVGGKDGSIYLFNWVADPAPGAWVVRAAFGTVIKGPVQCMLPHPGGLLAGGAKG